MGRHPREVALGTGSLSDEDIAEIQIWMQEERSMDEAETVAQEIVDIIKEAGADPSEFVINAKGADFSDTQQFELRRGGTPIAKTKEFQGENKRARYYICLVRALFVNYDIDLRANAQKYFKHAKQKGYGYWEYVGID